MVHALPLARASRGRGAKGEGKQTIQFRKAQKSPERLLT